MGKHNANIFQELNRRTRKLIIWPHIPSNSLPGNPSILKPHAHISNSTGVQKGPFWLTITDCSTLARRGGGQLWLNIVQPKNWARTLYDLQTPLVTTIISAWHIYRSAHCSSSLTQGSWSLLTEHATTAEVLSAHAGSLLPLPLCSFRCRTKAHATKCFAYTLTSRLLGVRAPIIIFFYLPVSMQHDMFFFPPHLPFSCLCGTRQFTQLYALLSKTHS